MGAEVSNADSTITAVRGDTTLTMKLGETAATVIKNGVEIPLTMAFCYRRPASPDR